MITNMMITAPRDRPAIWDKRDGGRDLALVAGQPHLEPLDRFAGLPGIGHVRHERDDHEREGITGKLGT